MADPEVLGRLRALIDDAADRPSRTDAPAVTGAASEGVGDDVPGTSGDAVATTPPATLDPEVAKAVAFLTRSTRQRPLTSAEARDKLAGRDHPDAVVEAAIQRATATGLLDDRAFADAWVTDRGVKRGYGRRRLQQELRRRKVPDAMIDAALDQLDHNAQVSAAVELARQRAQRMPATLDPRKVAGRLAAMLVRRGFDSELAHRVAREVTALDRDWD